MADDIKYNVDVMRATAQVLEIMAPFDVEARIKILSGAVLFGEIAEVILADSPAVRELMKKVKPKPAG